jgi:hypothetical protein
LEVRTDNPNKRIVDAHDDGPSTQPKRLVRRTVAIPTWAVVPVIVFAVVGSCRISLLLGDHLIESKSWRTAVLLLMIELCMRSKPELVEGEWGTGLHVHGYAELRGELDSICAQYG